MTNHERHDPSLPTGTSTQQPPPLPAPGQLPADQLSRKQPRHSHGWLMWLMCLPMLALVGVLIATGALGWGGLVYALACLGMMAVMMTWMNHGTGGSGHR